MVQSMAQGMRSEEVDVNHEQLVAFVHALSATTHETRTGIWMEHSYARARGALPAGATPRVLLAPCAPPPIEDPIDVECCEPAPPSLQAFEMNPIVANSSELDSEPDEDGWESRIIALAPDSAHARLADRALEVLRAQLLARLAAPHCVTTRREAARVAARRLRSAMAPHWAVGARVPQWLHATLSAQLPRHLRRQYDEALSELWRAVPKLVERLGLVRQPESANLGPGRDLDTAGPWLVWVSESRWERRLSALVATRLLPAPATEQMAPGAWCAAAAGAARAALADILSEAGDRAVVVGGAGAGAALCSWLAAGARVHGVLLVAPALETAEGARDSPDDPLREVRAPLLAICGDGGARARALCARTERRLLEVRGVDGALRVPHSLFRRTRLTQEALDAAIAEECARWVQEVAEGEVDECRVSRGTTSDHTNTTHHHVAVIDDEELAHVTSGGGSAAPTNSRGIEAAEGRVVSRVSGGTPLALAPPRRSMGVSGRLASADIMQMPIVFADDARTSLPNADGSSQQYTRVIVAKRGVGAARPILVRRQRGGRR